jgi:hypothetical protein
MEPAVSGLNHYKTSDLWGNGVSLPTLHPYAISKAVGFPYYGRNFIEEFDWEGRANR